ncbi:MAG: TIGR02391 family protein [Bacillota bacterium]|nr:TIGR02391 family protein [Bacillota bacterium]
MLLLVGLSVTKEGRLTEVVQAMTLDEVDRRVNNLRRQLYIRAIHYEVEKYCIKDYLRKDYYDAVFEAAKGLAERVREITGLTVDGGTLFQKAFAKNDPYLFFNALKTDSEVSEFIGLKELLESIFHLVRNPVAHTPKINWKMDETKALDILTLISFAHKYLDECHKVPNK